MPDETPPNVKIYDRPAPKGPSPILLVIGVLVALVVGFFIYRAVQAPSVPAPSATRTGDSRTIRRHLDPRHQNFADRNFLRQG